MSIKPPLGGKPKTSLVVNHVDSADRGSAPLVMKPAIYRVYPETPSALKVEAEDRHQRKVTVVNVYD